MHKRPEGTRASRTIDPWQGMHDNHLFFCSRKDIVIDAVEVIHELTDEDVGDEAEDEEDNSEALKVLIEALVRSLCTVLLSSVDHIYS